MEKSLYSGEKVLVAGGSGTIGIPLTKKLLALGADVTIASLDSPEYVQEIFGGHVRFIRADLRDFEKALEVTEGQRFVFNLVGIKGSIGTGTSKAASYFVPYILFQTNLMEAAFQAQVERYLFVSSVCAYPPSPFHEEDNVWNGLPQQGDRYAGIAKRVGEIQGEAYMEEHGWDAVRIVRPANVYGPFDDFNPKTAQVIPALIGRSLGGENPLVVWGDGSAVRDFIFSEDVADGLILALEKAPACVPINMGGGRGVSIKELAETVVRNVPSPPVLRWDASKPKGDAVRLLSMERAERLIGYEAATSLDEGIGLTIDWYLSNSGLADRKRSALDV